MKETWSVKITKINQNKTIQKLQSRVDRQRWDNGCVRLAPVWWNIAVTSAVMNSEHQTVTWYLKKKKKFEFPKPSYLLNKKPPRKHLKALLADLVIKQDGPDPHQAIPKRATGALCVHPTLMAALLALILSWNLWHNQGKTTSIPDMYFSRTEEDYFQNKQQRK